MRSFDTRKEHKIQFNYISVQLIPIFMPSIRSLPSNGQWLSWLSSPSPTLALKSLPIAIHFTCFLSNFLSIDGIFFIRTKVQTVFSGNLYITREYFSHQICRSLRWAHICATVCPTSHLSFGQDFESRQLQHKSNIARPQVCHHFTASQLMSSPKT